MSILPISETCTSNNGVQHTTICIKSDRNSLRINHSPYCTQQLMPTVAMGMTLSLPDSILQRGAVDSFSLHTSPDRDWDPHSLLYTAHRDSFYGAKRPERGVDHPPSSASQVTY